MKSGRLPGAPLIVREGEQSVQTARFEFSAIDVTR